MVDFSRFDKLSVSAIAVPVMALPENSDIQELAKGFAAQHIVLLLDSDRRPVGTVRDIDLLRHGSDYRAYPSRNDRLPNTAIPLELPKTLPQEASVGEVRELLRGGMLPEDTTLIPIVDDEGRYSGYCASRLELLRLLSASAAPPRMGGMATPLGVYMTSGYYVGGVGWPGLIANGAGFAGVVFLIQWLYTEAFLAAAIRWPGILEINPVGLLGLELAITLIVVLALLRLSPMAGYHAAEHMTINAVEKRLPLTEENVRIQPREHMRCGTNLMVLLAGIQLAWISLEVIRPSINIIGEIFYIFFWIWLITTYWRRLGFWIQSHFTTRKPSRKQLLCGIKAGQDILDQYREQPHPEPGILRRIWGSGLVHIVMMFLVTYQVLTFIANPVLKLL